MKYKGPFIDFLFLFETLCLMEWFHDEMKMANYLWVKMEKDLVEDFLIISLISQLVLGKYDNPLGLSKDLYNNVKS